MKTKVFVTALLPLLVAIGALAYIGRDDPSNQEKVEAYRLTRPLTNRETEMVGELQALSKQEFWTGRLSKLATKGDRLPIYSMGGMPIDQVEHILGTTERIVVPEGTRFQIVGWSNVRTNASRLAVKFDDGQEGWLYSGYLQGGAGKPLIEKPYSNEMGIDIGGGDGVPQSIYDVPFATAVARQKVVQASIDAAAKIERAAQEKSRREASAIAAKVAASQAQAAKKRGVLIGMTKAQVIGSSWGKPRDINRTITARGTQEQWVYGGGYLYFQDDILTTIQN
jgi:hypothetical protein